MSTPPILVIGATGKTGRRIASRLAARQIAVRPGSRQSPIPFYWQQRQTWAAALDGIETAYVSYYPDLAAPQAPDDIAAFTATARSVGLKRLVLLTGRGESNAEACEAIVARSGLAYTLLRATFFAQNFSEGVLLEQVRAGLISMPASDVAEPFIDIDDIADIAVEALLDPRHSGRTYELTGPRLLSFAEAAAEMATAAGREIGYAPVSLAAFHAGVTEMAGAEVAELFTGIAAEIFDGRNASVADGVAAALGRPARDFSAFCAAAAATGIWNEAAT
jgi:uncharacterized protein YbjT (DUF2867 family)